MGISFFDQYSILHMASGIVAYFWGIKLVHWAIFHIIFEYIENTEWGMKLINNVSGWPGGKKIPDTFVNSMLGDNFFAILGWLVAHFFNHLGNKYNWYWDKFENSII